MLRGLLTKNFADDQFNNQDNDGFFEWINNIESALPEETLRQALRETGVRSLNGRKMSAPAFVWLIIALCLFRRESIGNVLMRFELPDQPSEADISQRRKKLGPEPIARVFDVTAKAWNDEHEQAIAGLRVRAIDGTNVRLADTPDIEERFGRPKVKKGVAPTSYPQTRVLAMLGLTSRIVRAAAFDHCDTSEAELLVTLLEQDVEPSLFVLDRGFANWVTLVRITQAGHHAIMRGKLTTGAKARVVEANGPGDEWIEPQVSGTTRNKHPWMPRSVRVRRVRWREEGHRDKVLFTTVGPEVLSAEELIEQYRTRWEIELAYDEIKTHTLEESGPLRSRSIGRAEQEIWALLLAYNLVRVAMARAAAQAGLPPCRMRYRTSLLRVRLFLQCAWVSLAGAIPRHYSALLDELASDPLPERRNRSFPREAKHKPNRYARKRPRIHTRTAGS